VSWQRYFGFFGLSAKALVAPPVPNTVENDGTDLYYTDAAGTRTVIDVDGSNDVALQAATPGVQQVGNSNIDGTSIAGFFDGDGSLLTNLPPPTYVVVAKAAPYPIVDADHGKVFRVDTTTITLPDPTVVGNGWWVMVKEGANDATSTVVPFGGEKIDSVAAPRALAEYEGLRIVCDATDWWIV